MNLLFMRHGQAEPFGFGADQDRALTAMGRLMVQQQLELRYQQLAQAQVLIYSPYKRTVETAEIIQRAFPSIKVEPTRLCTPEANPLDILPLLESYADKTVLCVTHNPFVGRLVSLLDTGDLHRPVPMDVAMLALVNTEWPCAALATRVQIFAYNQPN